MKKTGLFRCIGHAFDSYSEDVKGKDMFTSLEQGKKHIAM